MIGLLIDLFDLLRGKRKPKPLDAVVPRLKHTGFVDAVRAHLQRQPGAAIAESDLQRLLPITRPFAGDLVIAYAVEGETDWQFVGEDFLATHKLDREALHAKAMANANPLVARQIKVGQVHNFLGIQGETPGIASTVALFPQFWKPFEQKFGSDLLATVPGRDFLAFLPLPQQGPEREKALVRAFIMKNAAISAFEASGNHSLSEFCFRVRDGKFEVREQLGDQDEETAALLSSPRGQALLAECGAG
jgi:hypothetical protein